MRLTYEQIIALPEGTVIYSHSDPNDLVVWDKDHDMREALFGNPITIYRDRPFRVPYMKVNKPDYMLWITVMSIRNLDLRLTPHPQTVIDALTK